jgi:hypothetical protein
MRNNFPISYALGLLLSFSLLLALPVLNSFAAEAWRDVENLTPEDRALFDPSTDTPRDSSFPYFPAEAYPFEAPFTAEEMGFRAGEFPHLARWSHYQIAIFGAVTSTGYTNQGMGTNLVFQNGRPGLEGYAFDTAPREAGQKWNMYSKFPPAAAGRQFSWQIKRTDQEHTTKLDISIYFPQQRKVRRLPSPRRDERFPSNAQTYDDMVGRDPWQSRWELIGTDVIYETVRYPDTRPVITLNPGGQGFVDVQTASIKPMGDTFEHYLEGDGVACWVVKGTFKSEWLPNYGEKYLVLWLEKHTFFPLRLEKYGHDDRLIMVETRNAKKENPARGDFGYATMTSVYWNVEHDLISIGTHDSHSVHDWTPDEVETVFAPEFMVREWELKPLRTQAEPESPAQFFLRPLIYPKKFPRHRNVSLTADVKTLYDAQEAAGHLVFRNKSD